MSLPEMSIARAIAAVACAFARVDDMLGHIPIEGLRSHRLIGALVKIEAAILGRIADLLDGGLELVGRDAELTSSLPVGMPEGASAAGGAGGLGGRGSGGFGLDFYFITRFLHEPVDARRPRPGAGTRQSQPP
jgi:hypothetical protein